jgi:hypothetical protein
VDGDEAMEKTDSSTAAVNKTCEQEYRRQQQHYNKIGCYKPEEETRG